MVEFSVNASLHRCLGRLLICWIDAAGNIMGEDVGPDLPIVASSPLNPEEPPRYVILTTAHGGAVWAIGAVRKDGTLAGSTPANSHLFLHKPMLGPGHERRFAPSACQVETPSFLPRAGARDGMATDTWEDGSTTVNQAPSNAGDTIAYLNVAPVVETEPHVISAAFEARALSGTTVSVLFQHRSRPDGSAYTAWTMVKTWSMATSSSLAPFSHAEVICGRFDDIEVRLSRPAAAGATSSCCSASTAGCRPRRWRGCQGGSGQGVRPMGASVRRGRT